MRWRRFSAILDRRPPSRPGTALPVSYSMVAVGIVGLVVVAVSWFGGPYPTMVHLGRPWTPKQERTSSDFLEGRFPACELSPRSGALFPRGTVRQRAHPPPSLPSSREASSACSREIAVRAALPAAWRRGSSARRTHSLMSSAVISLQRESAVIRC